MSAAEEKRNDLIDFLIDGMQDIIERPNLDTGQIERVAEFNPEIAWFKGHMINRPFGRYAYMLKFFESLADQCFNFMSPEPATELKKEMLMVVNAHKRSIDGKSSETWRDSQNTQSSLTHILSKNKVERQYTLKGEAKKSLFDGLMGRRTEEDDMRE